MFSLPTKQDVKTELSPDIGHTLRIAGGLVHASLVATFVLVALSVVTGLVLSRADFLGSVVNNLGSSLVLFGMLALVATGSVRKDGASTLTTVLGVSSGAAVVYTAGQIISNISTYALGYGMTPAQQQMFGKSASATIVDTLSTVTTDLAVIPFAVLVAVVFLALFDDEPAE